MKLGSDLFNNQVLSILPVKVSRYLTNISLDLFSVSLLSSFHLSSFTLRNLIGKQIANHLLDYMCFTLLD